MLAEAADLIARCRREEPGARDELFRRYTAYLHVLARGQVSGLLRGKCDTSDVVQMTLLEAHRDFAAFQGSGEAELLGWLRRILSHNLYNEARRYAAAQRDAAREVSIDQVRDGVERSSAALARTLPDLGPSPSQQAQRREAEAVIAEAVSRLPEDYQTVLILRVFEERPAEEVAERMGRTAGAVRMLQMRALAALREAMG
jgi:RNA polymerase sigma-70 factor (ECF subfamily)